ncbi:D-alanyl-D-alanine carboxypeptidase family protein [Kineococcus gynurae]|uniref:D-alanyl-D-alanine carboxypeptidase family protein n=1 Tax=Kineococcus gynurae TaxID=452979 RepID=A0ABV5LVM8_9ACTN
MPSRFAAEVLPDGRRRYPREAVLARRRLLGGVVLGGAAAIAGSRLLGRDEAVASPGQQALAESGYSLTDPTSPWVVVNKRHPLDPIDHAPRELVTVGDRPVAAAVVPDLQELLAAAEADGVSLVLTSGYRSFADQQTVHAGSRSRNGDELAEQVSARPGFSEHQTGFAVDFGSRQAPECAALDCFADTPEARWLGERAGGFGFLLRYPPGLTAVTGYAAESWHHRWVGRDLTARLARAGVATLEEFFGVPGGPTYA